MQLPAEIITLLENPLVHLPLILLGSILLDYLTQLFIGTILKRLTRKTKATFDDKVIEALRRPVGVSVVLGGCWYALKLCELPPGIETFTKRVLISAAILVWTGGVLRIAAAVIDSLSRERNRFTVIQHQTKPLFLMITQIIVIGAAVYFLFVAWESDVSAWLASAGIVGLAVGFAAKDTLANLFSGIFIIADGPYKLGDYVVLDNSTRGRVTHIGIRSTRILTRDDVEVVVPNAVIGNAMIINESGGPYEKYRLRVACGVAYGSDADQVEQILLDVAANESLVEAQPKPRVRFRAFGDSSLDFELLVWIARPELRGEALHHLNVAVYKALNQNGVEIPFPKRDVYLHQA